MAFCGFCLPPWEIIIPVFETFTFYQLVKNISVSLVVAKRDCYARGLGFDSQVEQKVLFSFSIEILSSSSEVGFVPGYMAIGSPPITWDLKHTGEPWVYIGTPLPNPSGNTGVMVCIFYEILSSSSAFGFVLG